jgi:hypothetical protein
MRTAYLLLLLITAPAFGQDASLSGRVTDPSGAMVASAVVTLQDSSGQAVSASTGPDGTYAISRLHIGDYGLSVAAPQLSLPEARKVTLHGGANTADLRLALNSLSQKISVDSQESKVSTDPTASAGALVLAGTDLDALGDDPEDLAADLQALAGPAAGPGGGAIFVDGFSGGQLPPSSRSARFE